MRSLSKDSRTQPVPSMSAWADGSASTANTASGAASIVVDAVTRSVSIPVRRLAVSELIVAREQARRGTVGQAHPSGSGPKIIALAGGATSRKRRKTRMTTPEVVAELDARYSAPNAAATPWADVRAML